MASEKELAFNWDMGDGVSFNFKCFIDRIDFVEGKLRIVDYKTGSDDVQISKPDDFEDLFAPDSNGAHKKALLQLLLYCNAYATHEHYADDITPVIYKFRDVDKCLNGKYDIQQSYLNGKSIRYKPVDGYLNDLKMTSSWNGSEKSYVIFLTGTCRLCKPSTKIDVCIVNSIKFAHAVKIRRKYFVPLRKKCIFVPLLRIPCVMGS